MSEETKYYGGTVTVPGRDLVTSLLAGEQIEFTRIVVGSGELPAGVHPMDVKDLVNPVANASSTLPVVEDGSLYLTVEYRNDMNGGLEKGFWLSEFGIYAKTENTPEILFYYATLGDSPQPVNAYKDNRIDIRRYPVTIELALDANIEVSYKLGSFITTEEAADLVTGLVNNAIDGIAEIKTIKGFTIPTTGWLKAEDAVDDYAYYLEIRDENFKEAQVPMLVLDKGCVDLAGQYGLCSTSETLDGKLVLWSKGVPLTELTGELTLIQKRVATGSGATGGNGGGNYVLPVATSTTLGGVMVKPDSGLNIDTDGYLSVNTASDEEVSDTIDDVFDDVVPPSEGDDPENPSDEDVPPGYEIATDEEVRDVVADIFG